MKVQWMSKAADRAGWRQVGRRMSKDGPKHADSDDEVFALLALHTQHN